LKRHLAFSTVLVTLLVLSGCSLFAPSTEELTVAFQDLASGMSKAKTNALTNPSATDAVYALSFATTGTYTSTYKFTNYAGSVYTLNGTVTGTFTSLTGPVTMSGSLTLTGGAISTLVLDYTSSGDALSGTMTANGFVYDASTLKLK